MKTLLQISLAACVATILTLGLSACGFADMDSGDFSDYGAMSDNAGSGSGQMGASEGSGEGEGDGQGEAAAGEGEGGEGEANEDAEQVELHAQLKDMLQEQIRECLCTCEQIQDRTQEQAEALEHLGEAAGETGDSAEQVRDSDPQRKGESCQCTCIGPVDAEEPAAEEPAAEEEEPLEN